MNIVGFHGRDAPAQFVHQILNAATANAPTAPRGTAKAVGTRRRCCPCAAPVASCAKSKGMGVRFTFFHRNPGISERRANANFPFVGAFQGAVPAPGPGLLRQHRRGRLCLRIDVRWRFALIAMTQHAGKLPFATVG